MMKPLLPSSPRLLKPEINLQQEELLWMMMTLCKLHLMDSLSHGESFSLQSMEEKLNLTSKYYDMTA
jgi:hypothetical protein